MNSILQLKGRFDHKPNGSRPGPTNLPKKGEVNSEHIEKLKNELISILGFWEKDTRIEGALVSVHYRVVVAKSNRLKALLCEKGKTPNDSIRGAKFEEDKNGLRHVFTHFVSLTSIDTAISILDECGRIVKDKYNGIIRYKDLEKTNAQKDKIGSLSKTLFAKAIVDCYWVRSFEIDRVNLLSVESAVVTLYRTGISLNRILELVGIDPNSVNIIDDTTAVLNRNEIELLHNKMSYLIAMQVSDLSKIDYESIVEGASDNVIHIPHPNNEPVIGVIDTHFDEDVYFSKWVDYKNCLSDEIEIENKDKEHGTEVDSIIVDGPSFNPELEDNCGRFRVKHFGVCTANGFSVYGILKMIRDIVAKNTDIKVWNLSLGSYMEIEPNFISPAAAELDRIQYEYDVIFVVAGTNKGKRTGKVKIGSPADSLNSIVVNSVDFDGKAASYTREGPVLSFFYKPDVSYYGGDKNNYIRVCGPYGEKMVVGTSFAAPWITRKVAYLIYIMGFSREVAKALIIDSAAGWSRKDINSYKMGYGIVPIKIDDILTSKNNEIRFIMTGSIKEYETFTYNIPVPQDNKGFPYYAKATLAYFPKCDRNQGVDYTSTEMDIHFGRIFEKDGRASIKSIDNNIQAEEEFAKLYEADMRNLYRKWDNVKHISEKLKERGRAKKVYESGMWGLSIKTKERSDPDAGKGLQFGVVVTLYEMNGTNRIGEFIKLCMMKNWLVNTVDIQNRLDIYNVAEEEIDFE